MYIMPDFTPNRPWFAGKVFIDRAIYVYKKQKEIKDADLKDKITFLAEIFLARVNIIRGIRTLYRLPPDREDIHVTKELKSYLKEDHFNKLAELYSENFEVMYEPFMPGSCRIVFKHKGKSYTYIGGGLNIETKSDGIEDIIEIAIKERLDNLKRTLELVEDIFFEKYYEDIGRELIDDLIWEGYEETIADLLCKIGYVDDYEQALEMVSNDEEGKLETLVMDRPDFEKLIDDYRREVLKMGFYHFSDFDELDKVLYYGGD